MFELCCIPFFMYGAALGDQVVTDKQHVVKRVIQRSGRQSFRVWFGNANNPPREEVAAEMETLGCLIEWSSPNLLAIDAEDESRANAIVEQLSRRQSFGELIFEATKHRG